MMATLIPIVFLIVPVAYSDSQNFDAARALMLNSQRSEAISMLKDIYNSRHDSKAQAMIENFATQFQNQEGESLYYQAINLIGARKYPEAKEKLDQANAKDPDHMWILLRLAQVEKELGLLDAAEDHTKSAIKLDPFSKDPKIMLALVKLAQNEEKEAAKALENQKQFVLSVPELFYVYLGLQKSLGKSGETESLKKKLLAQKQNPPLVWIALQKSANLNADEQKIVKAALDKCIKEGDACVQASDQQSKKTQFLWQLKDDLKTLLKELGTSAR